MIKRLVLLLLLFLAFVQANAATPPVSAWSPRANVNDPARKWFADKTSACQYGWDTFVSAADKTYFVSWVVSGGGSGTTCDSPQRNATILYLDGAYRCMPSNTAPDTTKPFDQQCPSPCPVAGTSGGSINWDVNLYTGPAQNSPAVPGARIDVYTSTVCVGSCSYTGDAGPPLGNCYREQTASAGGYYKSYCSVPIKSLGSACSNSNTPGEPGNGGPIPPSTPNGAPNSCPPGTISGGIDSAGIPICIGKTTDQGTGSNTNKTTTSGPSTTTTGSDGTKTTTQSTTQANSDGSTTTTTVTTIVKPDGTTSTSTSTNTTNATNGQPGKRDLDNAEKDLCQRHPELNICTNSTVAGTCGEVTCNGDAIQCATLRATSEANCREKDNLKSLTDSPMKTLGDSVIGGNDPIGSGLPTKANAATVDVGQLDASGWLGGGQCFADKTFVLRGQTVTIPFSKACEYLVAFRYALMLVSLLASFRMISGAIFKG